MKLIFIHGWGFDPSIWGKVLDRLDYKLNVKCIDLGFFHDEKLLDDLTDNAIFIGHSLGVLWTLKHRVRLIKALISICGFDQFVPYVEKRQIRAMQIGAKRDAEAQLKKFWLTCGLPEYQMRKLPDDDKLVSGLDWLADWNCKASLKQLNLPKLILASEDDKIVSKDMSAKIWCDEKIVWSPHGGHALPLTRPEWIAKNITEFVNGLE